MRWALKGEWVEEVAWAWPLRLGQGTDEEGSRRGLLESESPGGQSTNKVRPGGDMRGPGGKGRWDSRFRGVLAALRSCLGGMGY